VEGKETCCLGRFSGSRASAQVRLFRRLVFFCFDTAFPDSVSQVLDLNSGSSKLLKKNTA